MLSIISGLNLKIIVMKPTFNMRLKKYTKNRLFLRIAFRYKTTRFYIFKNAHILNVLRCLSILIINTINHETNFTTHAIVFM